MPLKLCPLTSCLEHSLLAVVLWSSLLQDEGNLPRVIVIHTVIAKSTPMIDIDQFVTCFMNMNRKGRITRHMDRTHSLIEGD